MPDRTLAEHYRAAIDVALRKLGEPGTVVECHRCLSVRAILTEAVKGRLHGVNGGEKCRK